MFCPPSSFQCCMGENVVMPVQSSDAVAARSAEPIEPEAVGVGLSGLNHDKVCRFGMAGPLGFRQYPRGNRTTGRYQRRSGSRRIRGECVS